MKLWGGRFTKQTDSFTDHFHSSISFDSKMAKQDIEGSIAHAKMLGKQNIIPVEDSEKIQIALKELWSDIESGKVEFDESAEDIHMNIETLLIDRIGEAGKRLHTGRSRNDQVALDIRMYVKEKIVFIQSLILDLVKSLNDTASENLETIMPGYTHLQRAQPITFAHHMLAYTEMLKRDFERLSDVYKRTNICPLGSGALATTTYPLDRDFTAKELGFDGITLNSLDAVSDRDFLIELLSSLSILMMHTSRLCEEIVIWQSSEFKFVQLDDSYSTGSSIMPQKKNPDMAELIRGKTGRVYGDLIGLLTVMKGLPLAYNKDMQEDKESVFDAIETVEMVLPVLTGMINTMVVNENSMYKAAGGGFTNATDAADWLVKEGMAFRDAHEVIGKMVLYCIEKDKPIEELSLEELQSLSPTFNNSVYDEISLSKCVESRKLVSGPAKEVTSKHIEINKEFLKQNSN